MRSRNLLAVACLAALAATTHAQMGTSEVSGKVEDSDGNPVQGAVVTLTNLTNSALSYTAKTGKKGSYFIPNLLYNEPGEWHVTVAADGHVPHRISVESRKSDKTLVGEYETSMKTDQPHTVLIKAFGKARLDFVMLTDAQVAAREQQRLEQARARAEAEGEVVVQVDPMQIASQKIAEGDLEGSVEFFQKGIEADPGDPERRKSLAKVLYNLERFAKAEAVTLAALELAPDDPELNLLLADAYARQRKFVEARARLDQVAAVSPGEVGVHRRMAWISEQEGDATGAIVANEAVVAIEPDNVEAWLALGSLYADAGRLDDSEAAFTRVVELNPSNAFKTFFNIGLLIENKADPSPAEERRALEAFQKAVEINPEFAKAHRHLAYALLRSGDLPGARRELQRYLELAPEADDAGEVQALVSSLPQ